MISNKLKNEIIQLVNEGIELEIISEESGIGLDELQEIILQHSTETNMKSIQNDSRKNRNSNKMKILIEKYNEKIKKSTPLPEALSLEESAQIDMAIEKILDYAKDMQDLSDLQKKRRLLKVSNEFEKISDMPLNFDQVMSILEIYKRNIDNFSRYDEKSINIYNAYRRVNIKLLGIIAQEVDSTDSIEVLKKFSKMVDDNSKKNDLLASSIKMKISNKIHAIIHQQALDKIKYEMSINVKKMILGIANGAASTDEIMLILQEETEKKINNNKSKGNFAIASTQARQQIMIQVRRIIAERANEFPVNNPNLSLKLLDGLENQSNYMQNLNAIVKNLCCNRRYVEAKQIVAMKSAHSNNYAYFKMLKKDIACKELADLIIDMLENPKTEVEEQAFIDTLEKQLKKEKISLSSIILGKQKHSEKLITLNDIWYEKNGKNK